MEYRNTIKLNNTPSKPPQPKKTERPKKPDKQKKPDKSKKNERKRDRNDKKGYISYLDDDTFDDRVMDKSETRGKSKGKRKRGSSLLKIVDIILGLVIVALITFLLSISVFQIRKVTVVGSKIWDENTIKSQTIIQNDYKNNGLYQYFYRLIRPVKEIPFVESAKLSFETPSHLVITVQEKKLLGRAQMSDGKYVYFNDDGVIKEISDKLVDGVLPVNGLVIKKPKPNDKLAVGSDCLATMLNIVKSLKKYNIKIDTLDFENNASVKVKIGTITADFGKFSYINEKIMRLNIILPKLVGKTGVLHMENWTPDSTDIVFEIL
jgi:cell division protein FtsQ